LFVAQLGCLVWFIATLPLSVVYVNVIAEGLRIVVPPLAQKIHALPGLGVLNEHQATHALDLALPFSVFSLLGCSVAWNRLLRLWLGVPLPGHERWHSENYPRFILGLGGLLLASDCYLFYSAMGTMSWGADAGVSVGALVATAAYVCILVVTTFINITLHQKVEHLRGE